MSGEKILLVEDDTALLLGLMDNFEAEGYDVKTARDGKSALTKARSWQPDLIILDVMMPEKSGYEVLAELRQEGSKTPIILLTAKSEEDDVVRGLRLGADDYITKPFSLRELLARVENFIKRFVTTSQDSLFFADFELDMSARRLLKSGSEIILQPKEFNLLLLFLQKPGKALSRDEIMDEVWEGVIVSTRSVDRCVTTLRSKIEKTPSKPKFIHTIRDFGYRFEDL
jgi:DNA-binding response OmpR family regulator